MAALNAAPMVMKDRMDSKPIPVIPCTLKAKDVLIICYLFYIRGLRYTSKEQFMKCC